MGQATRVEAPPATLAQFDAMLKSSRYAGARVSVHVLQALRADNVIVHAWREGKGPQTETPDFGTIGTAHQCLKTLEHWLSQP